MLEIQKEILNLTEVISFYFWTALYFVKVNVWGNFVPHILTDGNVEGFATCVFEVKRGTGQRFICWNKKEGQMSFREHVVQSRKMEKKATCCRMGK